MRLYRVVAAVILTLSIGLSSCVAGPDVPNDDADLQAFAQCRPWRPDVCLGDWLVGAAAVVIVGGGTAFWKAVDFNGKAAKARVRDALQEVAAHRSSVEAVVGPELRGARFYQARLGDVAITYPLVATSDAATAGVVPDRIQSALLILNNSRDASKMVAREVGERGWLDAKFGVVEWTIRGEEGVSTVYLMPTEEGAAAESGEGWTQASDKDAMRLVQIADAVTDMITAVNECLQEPRTSEFFPTQKESIERNPLGGARIGWVAIKDALEVVLRVASNMPSAASSLRSGEISLRTIFERGVWPSFDLAKRVLENDSPNYLTPNTLPCVDKIDVDEFEKLLGELQAIIRRGKGKGDYATFELMTENMKWVLEWIRKAQQHLSF